MQALKRPKVKSIKQLDQKLHKNDKSTIRNYGPCACDPQKRSPYITGGRNFVANYLKPNRNII